MAVPQRKRTFVPCPRDSQDHVEIVGVNHNQHQVDRARQSTAHARLENQITFVKGDFKSLVEHSDLGKGSTARYGQIKDVLKPVWPLPLDRSRQECKRVAHDIEVGDGIHDRRSISKCQTVWDVVLVCACTCPRYSYVRIETTPVLHPPPPGTHDTYDTGPWR
ncbi:unnamed protein product [Tilletia laevis]|uniref:Uncharacterized protein n=2 Tax=Tilletia TaxID=13289 RepID=A0A177TY71_9BASI|nr:hypothetical protein CF336_g6392 [Tilletia laevis]KAE8248575.1 hypothetical protein A4X03_0g6745 [Tilletia caries]KAE8190239.1 hypothetical protein CF335_g6405 [Tilletia laevis]CAD6891669.1 unnamed protein product [Tilletia caries]CAD6937403.1 unnamed protein product [Tilletia caries]